MKYSSFSAIDAIALALPSRDMPYAVRLAVLRDLIAGPSTDPGIESALKLAVDWLCLAQDMSTTNDGGVSRHFSWIDGWGPSYPETTGYIVPTLLDYAERTNSATLVDRAVRMLDWLVSIQNPDGSFNGGTIESEPRQPVLFNTGQILIGLAAGAARVDRKYVDAAARAAKWMVGTQSGDGAWHRFASPFAASGLRAYDTHAAIGLLEAASVCGDATFLDAATRNVDWAIGRQISNGWFEDCCVTDTDAPLTHTIGYTVRGIISSYEKTGNPEHLTAAQRTLDTLLRKQRPDGCLAGRYHRDWNEAVRWSCLTGNAQISECWLAMYFETRNDSYLDAARRANAFVRRVMRTGDPPERRGAVAGAFPISGAYNPFSYVNWSAKFFIDSQLAELKAIHGT